MQVTAPRLTWEQLESCAQVHGIRAIPGYPTTPQPHPRTGTVTIGVCLRPAGSGGPYHRYGLPHPGCPARRTAAVCWHGHARFLRELFARYPDARVVTSCSQLRTNRAVIYANGSAPATAGGNEFELSEWLSYSMDLNVGSDFYPAAPTDLCTETCQR